MTKAQQLGITEFPYKEYDSNGNETYYENSDGFWEKREFDSNGNRTYFENSDGFWCKSEFDSNGNETYYENSDGFIKDQRPKYSYAIIKENSPYFKNESVLLENKYKEKRRYAMILKSVYADGSESITKILYSNDLQGLQEKAKGFISWYNYPIGIAKDIQGYLREI